MTVAASVAACSGSGDHSAARESAAAAADAAADRAPLAPDSAGWREVRLDAAGVRLRYPSALVSGVVDRSGPKCAGEPPRIAGSDPADSALVDQLVVWTTTMDARHAAAAVGFVATDTGWVLTGPEGPDEYDVDSVALAPWRGVYGEAHFLALIDDPPEGPPPERDNDPENTQVPEPLRWAELFAFAPRGDGCAVAMAWHGRIVRSRVVGLDPERWSPEQLRALLASARLLR